MIGLNASSQLNGAIAKDASPDTAPAAVSSQVDAELKPQARINVDLSSAGRSLSAMNTQPKNNNSDIDDSNLPDTIKQTLKQIREIRAKLEQALQKLQETMVDQHLTPEQRKARVMAVQNEIGSLNAALTAASASLVKLITDSNLNDEQKVTAGMLSMS